MKKRNKNPVPCAYCGENADPEKGLDHVFARSFFRDFNSPIQKPIKIPACFKCNNDKSKLETYAPLIASLASDYELSDEKGRGIKHLNKSQKEQLSKAQPVLIETKSGLLFPMVQVKYDWDSCSALYKYIAMGLVYEYCGKKSVGPQYSNIVVAGMPDSSVNSIRKTISCSGFFHDDGRYNGLVKYAVAQAHGMALVYFEILQAQMFTDKGESCHIIAVSMSNDTK